MLILMKDTNNNDTQKERYRYIGRYTVHAFLHDLLILVIKHQWQRYVTETGYFTVYQ